MEVQAIHVWSIERREQAVVGSTAESFEGWLARLLRPILQTMLNNPLQTWLQQLKQAAETSPQTAMSVTGLGQ